jgi:hypothetical protein
MEEEGNENREVGLETRLDCAKKLAHDMLNMPMNEPRPIWLLEQLLCLQELVELKGIKHRYHMWKDYSKRNNGHITEWNARTREVHERKIYSKAIATKQGVLEDFWFKPSTGKFNGEEFVEEYVQK